MPASNDSVNSPCGVLSEYTRNTLPSRWPGICAPRKARRARPLRVDLSLTSDRDGDRAGEFGRHGHVPQVDAEPRSDGRKIGTLLKLDERVALAVAATQGSTAQTALVGVPSDVDARPALPCCRC